jgi:hypothetical protein
MSAEQKLNYICWINFESILFDKLVKFKTDIVGG